MNLNGTESLYFDELQVEGSFAEKLDRTFKTGLKSLTTCLAAFVIPLFVL